MDNKKNNQEKSWQGTMILSDGKEEIDVPPQSKVILLAEDHNLNINIGNYSDVLLCVQHKDKHPYQRKAVLKNNSRLTTVDLVFDNPDKSTEEKEINLLSVMEGDNSEIKNYQAMMNKKLKISCEIEHQGKNTISLIKARGIVSGKMDYTGKVKVDKKAKEAKADQKMEMILLNKEAECQALPILEVENDDVNCSHGSAIGEIDKEQVFYLTSRGLNEKEAKKLILAGFMEPIINEMTEDSWKEKARDIINRLIEDEI